ncbi:MAG: PIN domain-containing protein [bacterium]
MIVLDSSFLIAYHNISDVHHPEAARIMAQLASGRWGRPLLLEYVFLETVTVLLLRRGREKASEVAGQLLAAGDADFVPSSDLFLEVVKTFCTQESGRLSFVDCAIITAARERGADHLATFDRDLAGLEFLEVVHA